MADFTDSLVKNIGAHSSSPVMTSVNMGQLGEKLLQARNSTLASLSQALSKKPNATVNDTAMQLPASEKATSQLELNVVEARNLTIADARKADTYCIVHYEGNTTSTLDKIEDGILPSSPLVLESQINSGAFKAFEIMMSASSPKWMHRVNFDVTSGSQEIAVFVYDRGNKLPNGEDRFLGMSSIVPKLVNKKTVELIFPLHGRPDDDQEVTGDVRVQVTFNDAKKANLKPEDFRIVRMIGQGSVGKVYEVIKRDSGRTYAMKVLSKRLLLAENQVDAAFNERNVLVQSLSNPFIAKLKYSFQTTNHLFLVMEYFPGGELFDFLERERCLSEKRCQFFAAEIVCAFDNIHSRHIVYRNLKPESILLDAHGHIALTDFGLCKQLKNKMDSIQDVPQAITQEYLSPEMVMQKPYGMASDWWALGVLMYELLTGSPPFHSTEEGELFRQILEAPVKFPAGGCITEEAKDFICQLLERDPSKRLGSNGGVARVKAHAFFKDLNWSVVYKKQMQLPFVPEVEEQLREEAIAAAAAIHIPMTKTETETAKASAMPVADQTKFKGFSYMREDSTAVKGEHRLGINPEDEDPEVDFWFRQ
ncbi:hypothetical protein [Parasitella parasitica]|uniref:Protein kinase domain-containing protein n=1 Tax=Parasitella parasitica TaxID=35722 RepID=A0A0B7NPC9_9FUNG|nr:hypothetical protein [Parasitella parasitica]